MKIERIENENVPFDLLFLADEDDDQIRKYKDKALFWAAFQENKLTGIIGLDTKNKDSAEILCIAVYNQYQNKKIGTGLIEEVLTYAKENEYKEVLIKTGTNGIKQLHLYQRCGFRFDQINRNYFTQNYKKPIYENGLQCVDQIVLSYRIYSKNELKRLCREYWDRFIDKNREYGNSKYEIWHFSMGESLPNKLIGLVKQGKKRGTSSALELYEKNEKIPEAGDISIITYGNGLPGCIIKTVEIRIKKYSEITEEEARLEGEGDLSLDYWQRGHRHFFEIEYEETGKEFNEHIPVIFERFEVIYDEDRPAL